MSDNEGWAEGYVEFSKVVGSRIREDGHESVLMCEGPDGQRFDMVTPSNHIPLLLSALSEAFRNAMIKINNPTPQVAHQTPKFIDTNPLFQVVGISGVVYPERGEIDLELEAVGNQKFVVSLPESVSRALFEFLLSGLQVRRSEAKLISSNLNCQRLTIAGLPLFR